MAIQPINLGTYANDGTGDDLRSAFQKVNANILELASTVFGANVGASPPISGVEEGELWWSTVEGRLYIKYGTSWIDASPADGFVEYDISAVATTGGVNVRLSGTDLSQDDIKIAAGANILVTRTDANTITLSAPSFTGNVTGNVTGNTNGIHTGNVIGDTTGFHTGSVTGNVTGNLNGYVNGNVSGNVTGDLTGDTYGVHYGNVIGNVNGTVSGNAGTVTNGVYTTGDQTIGGTKTFSNTISGNISGNAGSVTNGVYTNGSYADPTWLTSLAGSKVSGNISGNAGSVTNGVYTNGSYADPTWLTSLAGSKVSGNISGNAGSVTNGVYTTSSINALVDVDTATAAPATGQALVWNGTNWVPGTVATSGGGLDFGSFSAPAGFILDFGTF